jgi:hypothetical protein
MAEKLASEVEYENTLERLIDELRPYLEMAELELPVQATINLMGKPLIVDVDGKVSGEAILTHLSFMLKDLRGS